MSKNGTENKNSCMRQDTEWKLGTQRKQVIGTMCVQKKHKPPKYQYWRTDKLLIYRELGQLY